MSNIFEFVISKENKDLVGFAKFKKIEDKVYPKLVNDFVRQHYSQSQVEAIMLNYTAEPNSKHTTEFNLLQTCRREAKAYAKEILGIE